MIDDHVSTQRACTNWHPLVTIYITVPRLPYPTLPAFSLFPKIIMDSFTITMVAYTISMSMALIFAQRHNYEVDSNQELFAQVL
jgi:MFS superfamily sulfate permease-like transporter